MMSRGKGVFAGLKKWIGEFPKSTEGFVPFTNVVWGDWRVFEAMLGNLCAQVPFRMLTLLKKIPW